MRNLVQYAIATSILISGVISQATNTTTSGSFNNNTSGGFNSTTSGSFNSTSSGSFNSSSSSSFNWTNGTTTGTNPVVLYGLPPKATFRALVADLSDDTPV